MDDAVRAFWMMMKWMVVDIQQRKNKMIQANKEKQQQIEIIFFL